MKRQLRNLAAVCLPLFAAISPRLAFAAAAPSYAPLTYVSEVLISSAPGAGKALYALQNTGTGDVLIRKIEIADASTTTIASGQMAFWVYASTSFAVASSTSVSVSTLTWTYGYKAPLLAQASDITVSTAPLNWQVEGDTGQLCGNGQSCQPPLLRPLYVSGSNTATTFLFDSWSDEDAGIISPLVLNAGANRAIIIVQEGSTYSGGGGALLIRVLYNRR